MDVGHRSNGTAQVLHLTPPEPPTARAPRGAERRAERAGIHDRLRDDVRLLGDLLGEILRAQEGSDLYALVEQVRALAKRARSGSVEDAESAAQRCWPRWTPPRRCRWPAPSPTSWR